MAASCMVQARVPEEIQNIANQVIQASGLSVSDVVRMLMTRIAQDKPIPSFLFQSNAEIIAAFMELDEGNLKKFHSIDELFDDLCGRLNAPLSSNVISSVK